MIKKGRLWQRPLRDWGTIFYNIGYPSDNHCRKESYGMGAIGPSLPRTNYCCWGAHAAPKWLITPAELATIVFDRYLGVSKGKHVRRHVKQGKSWRCQGCRAGWVFQTQTQ